MTVLNQLEKWILDYEKVNGTPTMCEIKAQLETFKYLEKEQLRDAYSSALDFGYMSATRYEEPDNDEKFEEWFLLSYPKAEP